MRTFHQIGCQAKGRRAREQNNHCFMTRFLLIRHAATDSIGKRLSGRAAAVHLNEEGRAQAKALVGNLSELPISAIYSSPLERTIETAAYLADMLGLETRLSDNLLEINFGDWTNVPFADLDKDPVFGRFNAFRSLTRTPNGETMQEAQTRMITGLERLCRMHPGETVAVFSHSDMIKASIAHLAGIHLDLFQRLEISPASVSIVEIGNGHVLIRTLNYTGKILF